MEMLPLKELNSRVAWKGAVRNHMNNVVKSILGQEVKHKNYSTWLGAKAGYPASVKGSAPRLGRCNSDIQYVGG